jgi:putative tryptophan/tyrosine transport system substrate-binding protein
MRRREFISLLGSAAAWPLAAYAQPTRQAVGFLGIRSPAELTHLVAAFHQGLKEIGYVEGQNVNIEYRWAENRIDRLPMLATDLVAHQVAVIAATGGGASALAAKAATTTIPIVFVVADLDPVQSGLVASLNRPGGNITGISPFTASLAAKRLQLLQELVPTAARIGFLVNPTNGAAESETLEVQSTALSLGLQLHVVKAGNERDFDAAFATLIGQKINALVLGSDPLFVTRREQLIALSARHALPTVSPLREFAAVGGLLSYSPSLADGYRLTGGYVGRILKGAKTAELPVMQPTKFDLVINLKTAKALGMDVPAKLLALADEVIE